MPLLAPGSRLVIASHNAGKVREIAVLLQPLGLQVQSAAELDLLEPEETGLTFAENAALKARAAMQGCGLAALADDSGLEVMALDGAPGIYSARWAGPDKNFATAMQRIRQELETKGEHPQGTAARFICHLYLCLPDGSEHGVEGKVKGHLTFPPRGAKGFGYDPIFVPAGHSRTFAEMPPEEKESMSHRSDAFRKLLQLLQVAA